jgi:Fe-S-cluster containining protein
MPVKSNAPCDPALRRELQSIYDDLEADVRQAGPVCQLSGRCCRFEEYGHTLFVSNLEAELLLEDGLPPGSVVTPAGCPFQRGKVCTACERRPLGCRVFFCEPTYQERAGQLSEKYIARLKELALRLGRPWRYAPLFQILSNAAAPDGGE